MGFIAFVILAVLEIALAVRTCLKKPEKRIWRRDRLIVRGAETLCILLCMVFSAAQKWRFAPVLGLLGLLLVFAALALLAKRKKADGAKKPAGVVVSCILCLLVFCLFLVPAFIFTAYNGLPVYGGHPIAQTDAILIDRSRADPFESDDSFREVPVHFYYPADVGAEKYPLVVFSHGAFGYYQSNTSTYMELASNGYVVAALDHPHHAFFTTDTDGKTVLVDMDFIITVLNLNSVEDPEKQYDIYTQWMALRTGDMNFAVDTIKSAAQRGAADDRWFVADQERGAVESVLKMTDTARIGLMGHSMGGATAVQLGRERSDIAAVIDLDGTMLGEYIGLENGQLLVSDAAYPVPVLDLNNWESYNDIQEYLKQGYQYPNAEVIGHAETGFSAGLRDSKHMDFTDLPLLSPFLGKLLGSGERSTEETMTIVNSLVLQFFNCYLKGEGVFTAQEIY